MATKSAPRPFDLSWPKEADKGPKCGVASIPTSETMIPRGTWSPDTSWMSQLAKPTLNEKYRNPSQDSFWWLSQPHLVEQVSLGHFRQVVTEPPF